MQQAQAGQVAVSAPTPPVPAAAAQSTAPVARTWKIEHNTEKRASLLADYMRQLRRTQQDLVRRLGAEVLVLVVDVDPELNGGQIYGIQESTTPALR